MRRTVIINPKGGCGKTTIATNLASYFANAGQKTALMDYDIQGSSWQWLQLRGPDRPTIQGIRAAEAAPGTTRVWQTRPPEGTEHLIIDTPAALDPHRLNEIIRGAQAIIIPVLPSNIDIHAASRCIADLLIRARVSRRANRIAVVANRVRQRTRGYGKLERFLGNLEIPFVASLRDTQNYVHAVEQGIGIFELPPKQTTRDRAQWQPLIDWIESRPIHHLLPGGLNESPASR